MILLVVFIHIVAVVPPGVPSNPDMFEPYFRNQNQKYRLIDGGRGDCCSDHILDAKYYLMLHRLVYLKVLYVCIIAQTLMILTLVTLTGGITGVVCLVLSVRLAHSSLQHKLEGRLVKKEKENQLRELKARHKSSLRSRVRQKHGNTVSI